MKYLIALDIGSTMLKCHLYSSANTGMHFLCQKQAKVQVVSVIDGVIEINPDYLWNSIVNMVKEVITDSGTTADQISCLGFSCQRATFVTWDRNTGIPFHNFVTWKDSRASAEVAKWNSSMIVKVLKSISYLLYLITNNPRFLTGSLLKFTTSQVTLRLLWMLQNNSDLKDAVDKGTAMFGTLDTWLLYRLTNGRTYCTDVSCASSTGMYDPYQFSWTFLMKIVGVPTSIFPRVCHSAGTHFGYVSSEVWGAVIPITCCIADQSASVFGSRCFNRSDMKLTLGTGAFLDVNVGATAMACNSDLYPLICWQYGDNPVCVLEGAFNDCGTVMEWACTVGLFDDLEQLSRKAESVNDTDGVFFMFPLSGVQTPMENRRATAGFIGLKVTNRKEHLIRAVLEGIVFGIYDLYTKFPSELRSNVILSVDGGVSRNDFLCQSIADICNVQVKRPSCIDKTVEGVALLAGHVAGLWNVENIEESVDRIFYADKLVGSVLRSRYNDWIKCRCRFLDWP